MNKKQIRERITRLLEDDPTLDVNSAISNIIDEEKVVGKKVERRWIEKKQTCSNFWCKSPFDVKFFEGDDFPKTCPKCDSFNYELSDGIESGEKHYDGPRQDGLAHEVDFHFSKYKDGKGFWNK